MTTRHLLSALLVAATAVTASAQRNPNRPPARRPLAQAQKPDSQVRNRAALEGQVRDRLSQVARRQLGLNDAQAEKLQQTNAKFGERRRLLNEQERDIRMSLRDEMINGDSSRQAPVADLMDRMIKAQRQRIDLMEQEQRELAGYLTPMQRARYFGLEEQLRQRLQQMRGGEGGRMGPGDQGGGRLGRGRPNGPPPDGMGVGGPPPGQVRRRPPGNMPPALPPILQP